MMLLDTWQPISSFLTPATLFLLLNLVIATILLSSRHHRNHQPDPSGATFAGPYHFPLLRTTSPVLERLRSFTLHRFRSGDLPTDPLSSSSTSISNPNPIPTESGSNTTIEYGADFAEVTTTPLAAPLARTSSILERLKSINLYRFRSGEIQTEEVKVETTATSTATSTEHHYERSHSEPSRLTGKKKKMKKTVSVGGNEMEVRQRTTFRGRDVVVEEEVDARADDFINNFKEQLKIQRLNSILNHKEMLNRGS
ncbi:Cotton fiber expressed protein [Carex littledalei]|uniref:Cotton fiber expressed protein n=1 Tax=Carex littledalei TaxID=544730 RepID=A0A833QSD3_9POAL|nr:Cotton fiber expressed protein [Carex littledalei]